MLLRATPEELWRSMSLVAGERNPEMTSKLAAAPGAFPHGVQEVEEPRVDPVHIATAEISQQVIDLGQRVRNVGAVLRVYDVEFFASMRVIETELPDIACPRQRRAAGATPEE